MNKKQILTTLCVFILALAVFAFGRRPQLSAQAAQQHAPEVPEHVTYKHLFHHVMALKKKAEEVENEGKDSRQFRTHFIRQANLTQDQARTLDQVAVECDQEIQALALRAKPLIEAYRAQYPGGQVPEGQTPAPPPAELRKLSQERDAIILRARDRLRAAFGDDEFNRFDNFVKTRVASNIQQMSPQ